MELKTINELKLEVTIIKLNRTKIVARLCEEISAETETQLRQTLKEFDAEIKFIEAAIIEKQEASQAIFSRSLNKSKL